MRDFLEYKRSIGSRPKEPEPGERPLRRKIPIRKDGSFVLPPDIAKKLGGASSEFLEINEENGRVEVLPNIHSLARVYIEPTSRCNLTCQTCIRNTWNEPLGDMEIETFDKLAVQLQHFEHLQSIMFAGFGEPTAHKDILAMIKKARAWASAPR